MEVNVRRFKEIDLVQIKAISLELHPKWFDRNALVNIPIDLQLNNCLVAETDHKIVGFITFSSQNGEININWLGISPSEHRKGIGSKLLEEAEAHGKRFGASKIIVETVVEQNPPDGSYDETIKFYYSQDFKIRNKQPQEKASGFTYSKGILDKTI